MNDEDNTIVSFVRDYHKPEFNLPSTHSIPKQKPKQGIIAWSPQYKDPQNLHQ